MNGILDVYMCLRFLDVSKYCFKANEVMTVPCYSKFILGSKCRLCRVVSLPWKTIVPWRFRPFLRAESLIKHILTLDKDSRVNAILVFEIQPHWKAFRREPYQGRFPRSGLTCHIIWNAVSVLQQMQEAQSFQMFSFCLVDLQNVSSEVLEMMKMFLCSLCGISSSSRALE